MFNLEDGTPGLREESGQDRDLMAETTRKKVVDRVLRIELGVRTL